MLVLYFDYTSLASAVVALRVQRLADAGGDVEIRGIDVLGIDAVLPPTLDQMSDVERWSAAAADVGLPVLPPTRRPPTLDAHLVGGLATDRGLGGAWREAALRAYWGADVALERTEVLVEIARDIGLRADAVVERLQDPRLRLRARQRMTLERGRGIGGVPLLDFDGTLMPADVAATDLRALAGL